MGPKDFRDASDSSLRIVLLETLRRAELIDTRALSRLSRCVSPPAVNVELLLRIVETLAMLVSNDGSDATRELPCLDASSTLLPRCMRIAPGVIKAAGGG